MVSAARRCAGCRVGRGHGHRGGGPAGTGGGGGAAHPPRRGRGPRGAGSIGAASICVAEGNLYLHGENGEIALVAGVYPAVWGAGQVLKDYAARLYDASFGEVTLGHEKFNDTETLPFASEQSGRYWDFRLGGRYVVNPKFGIDGVWGDETQDNVKKFLKKDPFSKSKDGCGLFRIITDFPVTFQLTYYKYSSFEL